MKVRLEAEQCGLDLSLPVPRDCLNSLETIVRAATCLLLPFVEPSPGKDWRLPRNPGYGSYLSLLRTIANSTGDADISRLSCQMDKVAEQELLGKTIRDWRNYLSHGGVMPARDADFIGHEVGHEVEKALAAFNEAFSRWEITAIPNSDIALITVGDRQVQNFLVIVTNSSIGFFHGTGDDDGRRVVSYFVVDPMSPELEVDVDDETWNAVIRFHPQSQTQTAAEIRSLKRVLGNDLKPFIEPGSRVEFDVASDTLPLSLRWRRRTSEGAEERTDWFDLSAGDRSRRWFPPGGEPRMYRDFIRDVTRWPLVCDRVRERVSELTDEQARWTRDNVGVGGGNFPTERRTTVERTIGAGFQRSDELGAQGMPLHQRLDHASSTQTGVPQVYFLSGEAGVGKTHTLRSLALTRAV